MRTQTQLKMKTQGLLMLTAALGISAAACGVREPHFAIMGKSQGFLSNPINNKVDILWVIRNAGLMGPMQTNLSNSINSFMNQFVTKNFDYRIAVVTTDVRAIDPAHPNDPNFSGQNACLVGTPQIITPTSPNPVSALAANANVGFFGTASSQGLNAISLALSDPNLSGCNTGFLRSDAYLAVIEFSDVDDDSTTVPATTIAFLDSIKPPKTTPNGATVRPYSVSGIVVPNATSQAVCDAIGDATFHTSGITYTEVGNKFITLATQTNGVIADICQSDFSAGLLAVSTRILEQATAVHLASVPNVSTISVLENGTLIPNDSANGWTFDAPTNAIYFHGAAIPNGAGVNLIVNYTPADIVR